MCILFFFTYIYVLLLTRFHHVHVSLLFLFISSYVCNDLSEIKNMLCSVLYIPVLVVVLLLCFHSYNNVPPEPQRNECMAAVWGAVHLSWSQ